MGRRTGRPVWKTGELEMLQSFCHEGNSCYTLGLLSALKGNPQSARVLSEMRPPEPSCYSTAEAFAVDWQAYHWLRKSPALRGFTTEERKDAAYQSSLKAERQCKTTNDRIRAIFEGDCTGLDSVLAHGPDGRAVTPARIILDSRRKIERVLGEFGLRKATADCRWSGGATADHQRGTPFTKKMTDAISVTPSAKPVMARLLRHDRAWCSAILGVALDGPVSLLSDAFVLTDESRWLSVPKTAKTERPIAAEPTANAFLQQGVGRYIRRRLKRWGVDLDDQSWAQNCARLAHTTGLSTLDLESASDTIAFNLVRLLLPEKWFHYLCLLRTPYTRIRGARLKLEKFSSMGNAFTFELESLIFWALASSVEDCMDAGVRPPFSIYGDDIIISRPSASPLGFMLHWCGFRVNKTKSFIDGPFFESCGKHYFLGKDVTPAIQDEEIGNPPSQIRCYNRLRRWGQRVFGSPVAKQVKWFFPTGFKTPEEYRMPWSDDLDVGFLSIPSECSKIPYDPNRGFKIRGWAERTSKMAISDDAAYAYKLRRPSYTNSDPRGHPVASSLSMTVPVFRWYHATLFIERAAPHAL